MGGFFWREEREGGCRFRVYVHPMARIEKQLLLFPFNAMWSS